MRVVSNYQFSGVNLRDPQSSFEEHGDNTDMLAVVNTITTSVRSDQFILASSVRPCHAMTRQDLSEVSLRPCRSRRPSVIIVPTT